MLSLELEEFVPLGAHPARLLMTHSLSGKMKQTQMPPELVIVRAKEGHFTFNQVSKLPHLKGPTIRKSRTGPVRECNEVTPPNGSSSESPLIKSNDSSLIMKSI